MRVTNTTKLLAAAGILAAASAWAWTLYNTPPQVSGPDPAQIRELAARIAGNDLPTPELRPVTLVPAARRDAVDSATRGAPAPTPRPAPVAPPAAPVLPAEPAPAAPDPVENLALMGVTNRDGTDRAWLVDVTTQEREVAAEGESVFGLTVEEIEPDRVVLARGDDDFALRLGEKPIPMVAAPELPVTAPSAAAPSGATAVAGSSRRRSRVSRTSTTRSSFRSASRSFGGRSRSVGGRSRSDGRSSRSSSGRRSFSSGSGGLPGGFNAASMMNGRQGNNRSNTAAAGPTSNPQTARRRGSRLIGGARPLPEPDEIENPQTRRRRGTTSGLAFGEDPQRSRNQGRGR